MLFCYYFVFQTFPSKGTGTCHVSLHAEYGLLHVSNYAGGSFTSLRVDKSSGEILGEVYNEFFGDGSHVKPGRQEASHAHGAWTMGSFIYVADLGADKIWHFQVLFSLLQSLLFKSCLAKVLDKSCNISQLDSCLLYFCLF